MEGKEDEGTNASADAAGVSELFVEPGPDSEGKMLRNEKPIGVNE